MGMHLKTISKLNNEKECQRIVELLKLGYSKKYLRKTFDLTIRELEKIIEVFDNK